LLVKQLFTLMCLKLYKNVFDLALSDEDTIFTDSEKDEQPVLFN